MLFARAIDLELKRSQSKISTKQGHSYNHCNILSHLNNNKPAHALTRHFKEAARCSLNQIKLFVWAGSARYCRRLWSETEMRRWGGRTQDDNEEEADEEERELREGLMVSGPAAPRRSSYTTIHQS